MWSNVQGNRLFRWSASDGVSVLRDPSNYQNGNYRDLEGRLVACSMGERAIIRREHDGQWKVLVDRYQGRRLNSPNDLVVKRDGTIWFTDPPYGITEPDQGYGGEQEHPGSFVYRFLQYPSGSPPYSCVRSRGRTAGKERSCICGD